MGNARYAYTAETISDQEAADRLGFPLRSIGIMAQTPEADGAPWHPNLGTDW